MKGKYEDYMSRHRGISFNKVWFVHALNLIKGSSSFILGRHFYLAK